MPKEKYYQALDIKDVKKLLYKYFIFNPKIEEISIIEADNRVLAENIFSSINVPHFNKSIRDGFAVRAEDTFNADEEAPIRLKVVDNIFAGDLPTRGIEIGECIQIATGAPIPDGANAIVMVEYSNLLKNNEVEIFNSVVPGQYIIKIGNDIKKGSRILDKDKRLNARDIGALAAIGKNRIKVYALPRITLFSTGNEIIPPNSELKVGKIYDINSYTLILSLKRSGAIVTFKGILSDEVEIAKYSIIEAFSESDLVILSGGTSKGIGDVFPSIIPELGEVELFIHGIRIKPGKPTLFASIMINGKRKLVTILPGNPTSALMVFNVFLKDIITKWSHLPIISQKDITAKLSERIYSELGRHEFKTVKLIRKNKVYIAIPTKKGSDAITTLMGMDGYFEIPEQIQFIEEGEEIRVIFFD